MLILPPWRGSPQLLDDSAFRQTINVAAAVAAWFDDDEYGGRLRLTEAGRLALKEDGGAYLA